ncbi:MAG: hypothetical protein JNK63_02940 [Chthonomonas sp.]|nr:hypothetical protein [Chthonomonas sp.]
MRLVRSLSVLAALAASVTSFANITGDFMGVTAENLVKELAKQSGEDLKASATVEKEILFLSVNGKPVEEVKARLAAAMGAEWKKEGDTWYLTRTGILAQQQKNKEIAARADRLRAELAKQVEAHAKLAAFDNDEANRLTNEFQTATEAAQSGRDPNSWRKVMELANQLPGARAIISLVAKMDMNALASIPAGGRQVFATNPTQMQLALPGGTVQLAQRMAADQAVFTQVAGSRLGQMGTMITGGGNQGTAPTGPATRALLIATRFGNGDGISMTFVAINAQGQALTTSNFSLGAARAMLRAMAPATAQEPAVESKPVTLRPESKELLSLLQQSLGRNGGNFMFASGGGEAVAVSRIAVAGAPAGAAPTPVKLSDGLRAKIMRPDVYDPMSFFVADSLKSISTGHKRDVLAVLPDAVFQTLIMPLGNGEPKTNMVLDALRNGDMEITDENGWVTILPMSPVAAREAVDREALARLLAVINRDPVVSLDDLANYFATAPAMTGFGFLTFESGYPAIIGGGNSMQGAMQMFGGGRDGLRFFGRLSSNQRSTLRNGGSLSIGSLSPKQREAAHQMTFWSMDGPRLARPNQPRMMQEMTISVGGGGFSMFGGMDPASERTNLLASGLPSAGAITMPGRTEEAVVVKEPGEGPSIKSLFQLAAERSGAFDSGSSESKEAQYQLMNQMSYSLTFTYAPNYTLSRQLQDPRKDPNGKFVAWDQLPVPFRNQISRMAQEFGQQEGPIRMREGRGPGGGPPRP